MKIKPCPNGPFPLKLWLDEEEFETIAEQSLRRHGLYPRSPSPVNIELFVDRHFGFSYEFRDMPRNRLGATVFGENGPKAIILNKRLDHHRQKSRNRVCRSTLAHECGHGMLHAKIYKALWKLYRQFEAKGGETARTFEEYRDSLRAGPRDPRWWEYQANRMMACLLVPRELLKAALQQTTISAKPPSQWTQKEISVFASFISMRFDVGPTLAEKRINCVFRSVGLPVKRLHCPLPLAGL